MKVFRPPSICVCGDHGFVNLTQGYVAIFDTIDVQLVAKSTWCAAVDGRNVYACTSYPKQAFMHRVITNGAYKMVDHEDGNGINNKRSNLRNATVSQNNANRRHPVPSSTGFVGVRMRRNRFYACATINSVRHHIGSFKSLSDAVWARYEFLRMHIGEFAVPPRPVTKHDEDMARAHALQNSSKIKKYHREYARKRRAQAHSQAI